MFCQFIRCYLNNRKTMRRDGRSLSSYQQEEVAGAYDLKQINLRRPFASFFVSNRTKAELVCRLYSLRSSSTGVTPAQLACWHGKMQLSLRMSFATTIDSRLKANSSGPSSGCLMAFHHLILPEQTYSSPGVCLEVVEFSSMRNGEFFEVSLSTAVDLFPTEVS